MIFPYHSGIIMNEEINPFADDEHVHMLDITCKPEDIILLELGSREISLKVHWDQHYMDKDGNLLNEEEFWAKIERVLENAKKDLRTIDEGYEILYDRTIKGIFDRIYFFKLDVTPSNQAKHSEIFSGIKFWAGDLLQIVS